MLDGVRWEIAALGLWIAGFVTIIARLLVGMIAVQWMSRRTEVVTDAPWLPLARQLAADLGVSPRVTFLRSPRATMPMAWGILRPAVLMPADADEWPMERLRIVLLHELAHVRRRDCLRTSSPRRPARSTGSIRSPGWPRSVRGPSVSAHATISSWRPERADPTTQRSCCRSRVSCDREDSR